MFVVALVRFKTGKLLRVYPQHAEAKAFEMGLIEFWCWGSTVI